VLAHEVGHISGRHAAMTQAVYVMTTLGSLAGVLFGLVITGLAWVAETVAASAGTRENWPGWVRLMAWGFACSRPSTG